MGDGVSAWGGGGGGDDDVKGFEGREKAHASILAFLRNWLSAEHVFSVLLLRICESRRRERW